MNAAEILIAAIAIGFLFFGCWFVSDEIKHRRNLKRLIAAQKRVRQDLQG